MNRDNLTIFCVTLYLPTPDVAAGDLRFFAMLQILAQHHTVDLFVLHLDPSLPDFSQYTENLKQIGVRLIENRQNFDLAAAQRLYDVGLFEFWQSAYANANILREQQPWVHIVIDSVDIHFAREEAGLAFGISDPQAIETNKKRELEVYRQADTVLVVTPEDEVQLKAHDVNSSTDLIPMVVSSRPRSQQRRDPEILFIGGFRHAPNVDGILWFINEIWPTVQSRVPDVKITIVGSHAPPEVDQLAGMPGVNVAGFVPETGPYLDRASLSIAPLRFGAGMKGKVTEAMASGLPVITTAFGAQGLKAISGEHLIVADDPESFAAQVVALLQDTKLAEEIGAAGKKHIEEICGFTVVEKKLLARVALLASAQSASERSQSRLVLYRAKAHIKQKLRSLKHQAANLTRGAGTNT